MKKILNYINGQFIEPLNSSFLEVYEPATGQIYAQVPDSSSNDVELAIKAAREAFPLWSQLSLEQRSEILNKIANLIDERQLELAQIESRDNGKPVSLAQQVDIPRAAKNFRFFASAILHHASECHLTDQNALNYTLRQALGVVTCISPWNLPLYLLTWKIAPALAMGNCVIAKPSEITPMSAYVLAQICQEAGLPAGVLNIIHGKGTEVGPPMTGHSDVKAVSFTGSTRTGESIAREAAPRFKKLSLEMGGKNPNIIFDDCNYEDMLNTTLRSSFANQGQICLCGSRVFIQESLYERFKRDFVKRTQQLKVGDPELLETDQGALVSQEHFNKVKGYIELAKQEGGIILCGGQAVKVNGRCEKGWFIAPTIIENLPATCRTNQEEIFGPVVTLIPFKSEEQVLKMANENPYGLSATIWTQDITRAHRLAAQIEAGIVWVNCWMVRDLRTPFGGIKHSGVGREGGVEALRFFSEPKNICIKLG